MFASNTTDWITAISEMFAAVGTVGAVTVALWQIARQGRRDVRVECRLAVTPDQPVIALRAINLGSKPVDLTMAYIQTNDQRKIISPFVRGIGDDLVGGKLLLEGESAEVFWSQARLIEARTKEGFDGYWFAFFQDTLGNVYADTFPGTERRRKWALRRRWWPLQRRVVYELPEREDDPLVMYRDLHDAGEDA